MAENDPRGGFSLLAPILNPKDIGISSITPEQTVSGEYQIPTISSMEELQQLPPNTSYDYFDPDDHSKPYSLVRRKSTRLTAVVGGLVTALGRLISCISFHLSNEFLFICCQTVPW